MSLSKENTELDQLFQEIKEYISITPVINRNAKSVDDLLGFKIEVMNPILKGALNIGQRSKEIKQFLLSKDENIFSVGKYVSADEISKLQRYLKSKKKQRKEPEEIRQVLDVLYDKFKNALSHYEDEILDLIIKKIKKYWSDELRKKRVLIIVDFTGVAYSEWPNAFFGVEDRVEERDLVGILRIVLDSVPISNNIAVWFDYKPIMRILKKYYLDNLFKERKTYNDLLGLKIGDRFVYIYLARLLVFLAEKRGIFGDILEQLRRIEYGFIWVSSGGRSTYLIPRLSNFVDIWISNSELRDNLKNFIDGIVSIASKVKAEDRNILLNRVNAMLYDLIERNYIDYRAARDIINMLIDFMDKLGSINVSLYKLFLMMIYGESNMPNLSTQGNNEKETASNVDTKETTSQKKDSSTIYSWAFALGSRILCAASEKLGEEAAKNMLINIIRELRNEVLPERFRIKLVQKIVDTLSALNINISFRSELKIDRPLRLNDFYRLSSLILMGLWDAYSAFSSDPTQFCAKSGENE